MFIPVTKDDTIRISGEDIWVKLRNMDDEVQIAPVWSINESLHFGNTDVPLVIKEIETQEEIDEYERLTQYHYKGKGNIGRCVPLIAKVNVWNLPTVIGFIELSSAMLSNNARKNVLNAPFYDSKLGFKWESWNREKASLYVNAIVRISRCVVYPELRGIGLSVLLTDAAVKYARERWHFGGLRPCFIEIIAEMLKYWAFVEKNGFLKVGETEGNLQMVQNDVMRRITNKDSKKYLSGRNTFSAYKNQCANKIVQWKTERNLSVNQVAELLKKPSHELSDADWMVLHQIRQREKPVYMFGLTDSAQEYLKKQMQWNLPSIKKHSTNIVTSIKKVNIIASVKPNDSERCRNIQEAFGIVSTELKSHLVRDLSFEFRQGDIVLISGASGVGKSLLLNSLSFLLQNQGNNHEIAKGIQIEYEQIGKKSHVVSLEKPDVNQAPIELLSDHSIDDAMKILARAGLAEAHLFVRPSYALSLGQSYRLSLALALAKKPDVLFIDEFCEPLDEYTSAVVCRKLRQVAKNEGICVVGATADARKVLPILCPNKVLLLSSNGTCRWVDSKTINLNGMENFS